FQLLEVVKSNLEQSGFGIPIIADSGNGYHLLYNVNFENSEEHKIMVEELLKLLDLMFSTDEVDIDVKVFNPSRITSLYGTLKQKGSNTKERPHRISRIITTDYSNTDIEVIKEFIKNFKYISDDDVTIENKKTKYFNSDFNLMEWLEKHNISYKLLNKMYKSEWNMYRLEKCYFNNEHDAPTLLEKNGYVKYKCHHNSCSSNTFKKMVEQISPDDVKKIISSKRKKSDLDQFHWFNVKGVPTKVIDIRVANHILKNHNLIMLNGKLYFYENGVFKVDSDDIKVKNLVKDCIFEDFVTSRKVIAIVSLIKDDESIHIDKVNKYESHIINFKNGMVNVLTEELLEHDPKYLSVNQIPHNYIKGGKLEDTTFYKFLESRIPDGDDKKMLFEFMGYCLTKDFIFQKMMFIQGVANSGKSNILNYIIHLVGEHNCVSTPMQMFSNNRFATSNLLNKNLCFYADLPDEDLDDVGTIKTMTGGDYIRAEYKGGKAFEFRNTAKLLFTCNRVPKAYKEKSNGLYRRY
ncbi:MAG: phage/plasmid primase, P4 family, partial [Coprobacillaceae bacterium]